MKQIYCLLLGLTFFLVQEIKAQPFVTVWDLATPGSSPTEITFGVGTIGVVNYTWETIPAGTSGSGTFTGSTATITGLPAWSTIRLSIDSAYFKRIVINLGPDKDRLIDVEQWGSIRWSSMQNAFRGCTFLQCSAIDIPNLSFVTSMEYMFNNCSYLNGPSNIDSWNVSNIQSMTAVFQNALSFNQPIGNWNTGNVKWMNDMFNHADLFNQNIGNWNTVNVEVMDRMFSSAIAFNQPIGNWNTSNVNSMQEMFLYTLSFNQPLGNWNTSSVTNMKRMFNMSTTFNQSLNAWDVSNVTDMQSMFCQCHNFNQPLDNWNTSSVETMFDMFGWAYQFNQPIGSWNTSNVKNMSFMFKGAKSFNQPIGNWNTSNVEDMSVMFSEASSFNQPIGNWNTSNVKSTIMMFNKDSAFNQNLNNWDLGNDTSMLYMFQDAISFNQPLFNWNLTSVKSTSFMFYNASSFNQSLGNWNLPQHVNLSNMFLGSGLDCASYTSTLYGWYTNPSTPDSLNLGTTNLVYGLNVQDIHDSLINVKGWIIIGDTLSNSNCCVVSNTTLSQTACNFYFFNNQNLTSSGVYYDTLLNASGCDSIIVLNLTINQANASIIQAGANLSATTSGATYQWISCNPYQIISGATNQNYTATADGDYAVIVTENGCSDTSACVTVMGIGLDNNETDEGISIYPNPTKDKLYVNIEGAKLEPQTHIGIYNTLGQLLFTKDINPHTQTELDISHLAKGMYYLRVGQVAAKVIVE
jgi:surface protein